MHASTLILLLSIVLALILSFRAASRARAVRLQGYALEPRPSEIQAALQAVPVFQQPRARKAYKGMGVRWQVTFESAITLSPWSVRLMLVDQNQYPWVWCNVSKYKYPQLNTLVQHAPLWVTGQISKITLNDIYLKNVQLEFEQ